MRGVPEEPGHHQPVPYAALPAGYLLLSRLQPSGVTSLQNVDVPDVYRIQVGLVAVHRPDQNLPPPHGQMDDLYGGAPWPGEVAQAFPSSLNEQDMVNTDYSQYQYLLIIYNFNESSFFQVQLHCSKLVTTWRQLYIA